MKRLPVLALPLLAALAAGCPPPGPATGGPTAQVAVDAMPTDPEALIKLADESFDQGGASVQTSRAAADRALQKNPEWAKTPAAYGALWRLARAHAQLAQSGDHDKAQIQTGLAAARAAVTLQPGGIEGVYFLAQMLGFSAQANGGDKVQVTEMIATAERAHQIDPQFDHGGPSRLLGAVYTQAPDPPVSVGDPDKGVQMMQRAVGMDGAYPGNLVYLAAAQLRADKDGDAAASLKKARELLGAAGFPRERDAWNRELTRIEKKLRAKQG